MFKFEFSISGTETEPERAATAAILAAISAHLNGGISVAQTVSPGDSVAASQQTRRGPGRPRNPTPDPVEAYRTAGGTMPDAAAVTAAPDAEAAAAQKERDDKAKAEAAAIAAMMDGAASVAEAPQPMPAAEREAALAKIREQASARGADWLRGVMNGAKRLSELSDDAVRAAVATL